MGDKEKLHIDSLFPGCLKYAYVERGLEDMRRLREYIENIPKCEKSRACNIRKEQEGNHNILRGI